MKFQNIVVFLVIPLALISIPSLLENVQAQSIQPIQPIQPIPLPKWHYNKIKT